MNAFKYEGVVAVKLLTNNLVAAVFTNGLVRIVRSTDAALITEFRLNVTLDCKVVEARIAT